MAENSVLGSADDTGTLDAFSQAPADASPRKGNQADTDTTLETPDQSSKGDSSGSAEDSQPDNVSNKRIADAQRKMHEEIRARATAETEAKFLKQRIEQLEQVQAKKQDEALFDWLDSDALAKKFEDDPTGAFQESMKNMGTTLMRMQASQQAYIDAKVQTVDPMTAQINKAFETLSGESWFHELPAEAKRGAAIAHVKASGGNGNTQENGTGSTGQPTPSHTATGSGHRVPRETKEVPMEKDPRFTEVLTRMGGLKPQTSGTRLNEV